MKYYLKFLGHDRQPCNGGSGQWPDPGVWTETIEKLIPRKSGYHLCRKQDLFYWCNAPALWVAEAEGVVLSLDKVVAKRARLIRQVDEWNDRNLRSFAADCAEHVLKHFEKEYPDDERPRVAIETVRRFASGQATVAELSEAEFDARSAAWSAGSASESAAEFAAWSASLSAAWSAAKSAAKAAAKAASYATQPAEHQWQLDTLFSKYLKLNPEEFE